MNFRRGMKVVCIDDAPRNGFWVGDAPVKGAVYTIADIFESLGGTHLEFRELVRSPGAAKFWGRRIGYNADRFRPAVERKTSIDVFTAMLAPEPNKGVKAPQKSKERV